MVSSVRSNFLWNLLLNISGYLYPILTFPYVTRVLGAEGLGIASFALSIVDYAILLASLGISAVGIRYIAQNSDDEKKRTELFNGLTSIHLTLSLVLLLIYLLFVTYIPQLSEYKTLYWIGGTKILFNVFLVEWLFQGMQDFRYITLRTLFIRTLYILGVFLFVRDRGDYDNYFYVTIGQIAINATINWKYSRRYARFKYSIRKCKEYLFPILSMGIDKILLSFYATFNVLFLGFSCGNLAVGYYTAAIKLYTIILSVIVAFNSVFVPYLNDIYAKGNLNAFREIIIRSIRLISTVSIPLIVGGIILAPQIIMLVAGSGYENAVFPFRVILIQVLFVGLAQVFKDQILLTYKKFKQILFVTCLTTSLSLLMIVILVPHYAEKGTALAVAVPHLIEIIMFTHYARKCIDIPPIYQHLATNCLISVPIIVICEIAKTYINHYVIVLVTAIIISFIYWTFVKFYIIKDTLLLDQIKKIICQVVPKKNG